MKKQILLFIILLSFATWGKNKTVTNPSIGVLLYTYDTSQNEIFFYINIKNTGEETLTNIYVTDESTSPGIQFFFSPIVSLEPGEEIEFLNASKIGDCYDESQIMVHATTSSNNEITDLSADPYDLINGVLGSYYNDMITSTTYSGQDYGYQQGTYNDLNNNGIIDVGDVIDYIYDINLDIPANGSIYDNNSIVDNTDFFGTSFTTTGIHYITQAEIDLGYVYNSSYFTSDNCNGGGNFQDESVCSCPNPFGANIITQLTSLFPNKISGKVTFDANHDNCTTGINFPNRRVYTSDGTFTYATYTDVIGNYQILIPNSGSYTTSALINLNPNFSSNPASVMTTSSGSGVNYTTTDFCISSATNYTDLEITMFNINEAIPGNSATYRIYFYNNGSTSLNGSIVLTYDNGKLSLVGATPVQNNATANTITWNYTDLLPFETRYITLSMNVAIPPTVNTNDLLPFSVTGLPITGDNLPANNSLSWNQTVRSSFDPNDKTVIQGSTISLPEASNDLTYVTRFQNTGTANASTVVIKETIDPKLDWDTFEPVASSHPCSIQIRNGNDLTYTFSNIDLAYEAANEPASHGWMVYKIKPKSNVIVGDSMISSSDIYFDYNSPVLTNFVSTEITALATTNFMNNNIAIYPNPTSNSLSIKTDKPLDAIYEISDSNGKSLLNGSINNIIPINVSQLQNGLYFLTIKTTQGKTIYKFIKN